MTRAVRYQRIRFLMTFWPLLHVLAVVWPFFATPLGSGPLNAWLSFAILYLLPPLLCRLLFAIFGKPEGKFPLNSGPSLVWFASSQLQILFLRFPILEEALILVPRAYSLWLRLWGARIGKIVFWSPQIKMMDRPFLKVGDHALIGFGARFTSHHVYQGENGELELSVASPVVGARAILGGESGLAPGAELGEGELLPSTMSLAPGYLWKGGRRHSKTAAPAS